MKKNALGKIRKTARGFQWVEFKDHYHEPCSLQASSIITPADDLQRLNNPGTSAVWLGIDSSDPTDCPRMHLNRKQVAALVHTLKRWLRTGRFV